MTNKEKADQLVKLTHSYEEGLVYIHTDRVLYENLMEMAEWKERQMIEKACRWLDDNITNDPTRGLNTKYGRSITHGELLQEFKKAMEE